MAQVSRRFINQRVKAKLNTLFTDCIARCRDQETTIDFLDDLLTKTEKIMLAKRMAIALMLLKGKDYQEIEVILKVSKATIWRIKIWLATKGNGFRKLLEDVIKKDKEKAERRKELLRSAEEDNPIWVGPVNWSAYKKRQWQKVRETLEEPF